MAPIKRNKNLVALSHDHHAGLLFCWKIRQGLKNRTDANRMLGYLRYFWQEHLLPHFREEEHFLFILPDDERTARARHEHHQIGVLVNSLLNSPAEDASPLLAVLADTVDNHIRFEERELFPHLEKQLSASQLEAIGLQFTINPESPDCYPDEYWKDTTHSNP